MNLSSCCHPYTFLLFSSCCFGLRILIYLFICDLNILEPSCLSASHFLSYFQNYSKHHHISVQFLFLRPFVHPCYCMCLSYFHFLLSQFTFFPISPSFICTVLFLYLFLEENPSNAHKAFEASYLRTKMPN